MFRNPVTDLIVVLVVVLLIFGPKRLPALGKSLGHGIREFKDGITGKSAIEDEDRPALNAAQTSEAIPARPSGESVEAVPAAPASPAGPERESAELGSERRA
jgi:sec-independent protein translocase protein TatA